MKSLLDIGFEDIGNWKMIDGRIKFELKKYSNTKNALYAFVVDDNVKYVGKTTNELSKRLSGYQNPGPTQSTNQSKNKKILQSLNEGQQVKIFARTDTQNLFVGEFHLNTAAGLEDSIIATLTPEWNVRGGEALRSNVDTVSSHNGSYEEIRSLKTTSVTGNQFSVVLHNAYYNGGFFNVTVTDQHLFGKDGEEIRITFGDEHEQLVGIIDRRANRNHTPRIRGRTELKQWFLREKKLMDTLYVSVVTPNDILVR